jgi:predicted O-methyltransferase YrrM
MKWLAIIGVTLGAIDAALYYLFFYFPFEHSNWDRIAFVISNLGAASIALLLGAGLVALCQRSTKRVALLGSCALLLGGYVLIRSIREPHAAASQISPAKPYEFSVNWVDYHVPDWQMLLSSIKGKPNVKALEIGSFEGRSAIWFLENILTDPSSSIVCIDIFDEPITERRYDNNIALSGFADRVHKIKAPSALALKTLEPESYDFIYVDGSHVAKDVLIDTVLSWELVKPNGIVIFDDYGWSPRSRARNPRPAIDAFVDVNSPYIDVIHRSDTQIALRKKTDVDLDHMGMMGQISKRIQLFF